MNGIRLRDLTWPDLPEIEAIERGRGLGRILLQELENRAILRGATGMMLDVRADNAAALGLYTGAGYDLIQTRRRYYQPGDVDALVLRKFLTTSEPRPDTERAHA